ncbi:MULTISPECIES: hypothetical protein [Enterobacteriaceae]|uniref:hypothetical protein n=1 Tax=Enterobacteriaceae TaxID=543 RepID=UPI000E2EE739|nr:MULTISPECIES: hypothetical protein [Enterobacteriaceae]EAB5938962.1 hypothetical protein [Salmonella enterica subsp. enterica serovar Minnesota]EBA9638320.1 hypothetical protein [Salmonella enterica subsp. enterica serovar Johannesburg]EBF9824612.1 hypothetical protein [Salmonella enterica subsp. enterica serovar Heidelberg]EAB8443842.1 hypothetical protein [Salmonella enterica subsp. enterica serovar Minnesota]EAS2530985.1 hypothetical protein [Salmonella enterica]
MEEFKGTPGVWDIDINDQTVLSDAGYKVADIDLIHGNASDVFVMVAAPELLDALQLFLKQAENRATTTYPEWHEAVNKARSAIAKALGK